MHEHVSKCVKMQIKPTGGTTNMASKASHGVENGEGMHETTGITKMHPKWLHPNKTSWASDVTTQPRPAKGVKCGKA